MSFSVFGSDITLCSGDTVATYNIDNESVVKINLPALENSKHTTLHNNVDVDSYHAITSVSFSKDGEYFLVCTNRKQLCLYLRKNKQLVSNRVLVRAASRVRFTPSNDVVVADKSGDAYIFSTSKPQDEGSMILGHLSMLLDILITNNEKYVLTADRDEKIRVSMYPNCYNILSYCLGHEKFVTNIQELPHDDNVLVSSSGDGCLKFWDYKTGKELLSINANADVGNADIEKFNDILGDCELDESVNILPVKHLNVSKIDENSSLVIVTLYTCRRLFLYNISGNVKNGVKISQRRTIEVDEEPLDCLIRNNVFWALNSRGLVAYRFNDKEFCKEDTINAKLRKINTFWTDLEASFNKQSLFPILYKRKFDNVQDYQDRKKSRLAKTTE